MKLSRISCYVALAFSSSLPLSIMAADAPGEIVALQGKGDYREEKESQWRNAALKQKLAPASFVRTGELSTMSVLLADQTQIKLGQNSTFQIRAVAGQPPEKNTQLDLKKGKAWSQTKNAGAGLFVKTPSALAGIHGTDWVIEVDDDGKTSLTVLSGVIELSNEHGKVSVGKNEYAEAEVGKAPVKRTLVNPKERVQWVTTHAFSPERYGEIGGSGAGLPARTREGVEAALAAVRSQDFGAAMAQLERAAALGESPVPRLLAGDLALARGELGRAGALYAAGRQQFPQDGRFAIGLGRVALYSDDVAGARALLAEGRKDAGSAVLADLLGGDIEKVEGRLEPAQQGYEGAIAAAPQLADGWFGRGSVRLEVEDVRRSREDLLQALALPGDTRYTRGELGTLESVANDLDAGRAHFAQALATNPGDYVALTGLGLLELKAGRNEQAFTHLMAANTIEPRYARGVLYLGVAYYLSGNVKAGLESLARASELDPKDPLPHLMRSLILQDQWEPEAAIVAAQTAVSTMPYLKSLNQVANDQKGSASLGGAVAQFGLENWAMAQAQQSYYPYWGGSHLFLADRYEGKFNKNAELMQGFLSDPTVFGADPRRQTLVMQPGDHVAVGLVGIHTKSNDFVDPALVLNGYRNSTIPVAYFLEMAGDKIYPGDANAGALSKNTTFGLGFKPNYETGVFVFGNHFRTDVDDRTVAGTRERTDGTSTRLDAGISYRFTPKSQIWLKAGVSDSDSTQKIAANDSRGLLNSRIKQAPDGHDLQIRHTLEFAEGGELTYGAETARGNFDLRSDSVAAGRFNTTIEQTAKERDQSQLAYASLRYTTGPRLLLQGDLAWTHYRKSTVDTDDVVQNSVVFAPQTNSYSFSDSSLYPRAGFALDAGNGLIVRGAYQSWRKPISFNTLAPTTTAGIVLNDQLVLPGGEQRGGRLQADWQATPRSFVSTFADVRRVSNLHLKDYTPDNQRREIAELERLQIGKPINMGSLETLETRSKFTEGLVRSAGIVGNQILTSNLTGYVGYVYSWTENRNNEWYKGLKLPWIPRDKGLLGATWAVTGQWMLQGQATYRSERFADELNTELEKAGWDVALKASWRSADRNVWVDAWAQNLAKPDTERAYGVSVTLRY